MAPRVNNFLAFLPVVLALAVGQLIFAEPSRAAIFSVVSEAAEVRTLAPVKVSVLLNTENDAINAVEGVIKFPETLDAVLVETGKSLISFWVEEPRLDKAAALGGLKQISFSGVMAGGVSVRNGLLFSLYLTPTSALAVGENLLVQLTGVKAVIGDGFGTAASATIKNLSLRAARKPPEAALLVANTAFNLTAFDVLPPDKFTPILGQSATLFDNQWFVAWSARDSGSGIDHYEVQETLSKDSLDTAWVKAQSPYLLVDQSLQANIFVKAVDKNGNFRVELASKRAKATGSNFGYAAAGIFLIVFFLLIVEIWRVRRKQRGSRQNTR